MKAGEVGETAEKRGHGGCSVDDEGRERPAPLWSELQQAKRTDQKRLPAVCASE